MVRKAVKIEGHFFAIEWWGKGGRVVGSRKGQEKI